MVDRQIVYQGATPRAVDQLLQSKNTMIGLGYLMQAVLGTSTLVDGLACTPNSPAALNVLVAPGSIYSLQNVDNTAYGIVAADTADQIVKQGIVMSTATLACPAPGTAGQSIVYLVQATYQDQDTGPLTLAYYNASNPSSPFNGPNNTGVSQNTVRQGVCVVQVKAGTAATTGSQVTPSPDAGYTGLWAVTVANGQTTITSPNIVQVAGAPFIATKLTGKLNAASNLSDVASASTSRANLGLGSAATKGTGNSVIDGGGGALEVAFPTYSPASTSFTVSAAYRGYIINSTSAGGALTSTIAASLPSGFIVGFVRSAGNNHTITPSGGAQIALPNNQFLSSVTLSQENDLLWLVYDGANFRALCCPMELIETSSLGVSGYQRLPSGLIVQWGSGTTTGGGSVAVTFPITFPTIVYQPVLGLLSTSPVNAYTGYGNLTTSGMNIFTNAAGAGAQLGTVSYFVLGK